MRRCFTHRFLRPRSRLQSGQRSKSCLSNNSKTTEANLTKHHRKIEHNEKVSRTRDLRGHLLHTVTFLVYFYFWQGTKYSQVSTRVNCQNYSLNFHQVQFTNGIRCIILQRFNGKCRKLSSRNFHTYSKTCYMYLHSMVWADGTGKYLKDKNMPYQSSTIELLLFQAPMEL